MNEEGAEDLSCQRKQNGMVGHERFGSKQGQLPKPMPAFRVFTNACLVKFYRRNKIINHC